jgi:hypothetical protein
MPPTFVDPAPLSPPPAGRLAARYAQRMRALTGMRRTREAVSRPDGPTAADTADFLRWSRPGKLSARRTSPR